MSLERPAPAIRPPVALGCTLAVAAVAFGVFIAVLGVSYLGSGANSGTVTLDEAAAYGDGTVAYIGEHNFYLVRLADGSFLALSDLDAANRASAQRRCRVAALPVTDPSLPGLLDRYRGAMSRAATGSTLLFREDCNGAVYDLTGLRLDGPGPNLDRFAVAAGSDGRLVVDPRKRTCTAGPGPAATASIPCR